MIGTTISHYKILDKLGEGGMGVVYKAEDTKLERVVALKFVPTHLLGDEEVKKRFKREAKAAADLDHSNVCTVYEIDEADSKTFISMALIEGESLDKKIERGPLKLDEALDIAQQIAKGLEAACEKGVVHRDIKPQNVMVDSKGHVTIMDFGLAQLTQASLLTRPDQTLGTTFYMSPEQTEGSGTDQRTDIWALGVVLYEMITGQRPFKGDYDKAVMYSILNEEPEPITGLRTGVPMELEVFVGKCIEKDAERRYTSASDLAKDLLTVADNLKSGKSRILSQIKQGHPDPSETHGAAQRQDSRPRALVQKLWLSWALLAVTAVAALVLAISHFAETPPQRPVRRFTLTPATAPDSNAIRGLAISPDGTRIAFWTPPENGGGLWIQRLDEFEPRRLEGTDGARLPFWSPGSDFIGFHADSALKKIDVEGGPAIRLCGLGTAAFYGGSWSLDGQTIAFSMGGLTSASIYEVSTGGGEPREVISPYEISESLEQPIRGVSRPHFLPSEGRRVLAFRAASVGSSIISTIVVQDLDSDRMLSLGSGHRPSYSPTGHLIYEADPPVYGLWALPFSVETLTRTGEPFIVAPNGRVSSVASDQTLVYLEGAASSRRQRLVWVNRRGEETGKIGDEGSRLRFPALSPDGSHVAVTDGVLDGVLWVWNVERGVRTRLTRITGSRAEGQFQWAPIWSPDGTRIADSNRHEIKIRQADGVGEEEVLASSTESIFVTDWSRDGNYILFAEGVPGVLNIGYLERAETGEWRRSIFSETPADEKTPRLSPDGRYLVYVSNETGSYEVYVQPFPEADRKWTVSTNGGTQPRWSRDGRELFYVEEDSLMAVPVSTDSTFSARAAVRLFAHPTLRGDSAASYDVAGDSRIVMIEDVESEDEAPQASIRIVQNWYEEFRDRD